MKRIYQVTALAGAILAGAGGLAVAHGGPDGERHSHHQHRHGHHKMHHGFGHKAGGPFGFSLRHIDGSLAFLKAELQITEQQEPQWAKVETALRTSADRMKELRTEMRGERGEREKRGERAERDQKTEKSERAERPRLNPVERLERMEKMATSRAESAREIRTALAPLYESMSDEQKERADRFMRRMPIGR